MSNFNKARIVNLAAMALTFANLPSVQVKKLAKLPNSPLDSLEKALIDTTLALHISIPAGPDAKATQAAKAAMLDKLSSGPLPKPAPVVPSSPSIEITITTVGNEFHVKTPFWAPFNFKCSELLPKNSQRFDKATATRIVNADQQVNLLTAVKLAFEKSKRPVFVTLDGKRYHIPGSGADV